MTLRLSSIAERVRSSLFFVPMFAVVAAAAMALGMLAIDRRVDVAVADLPFGFTSTVESARTLLGVIAGATISFAGVAFSVSLLILQLASSQYSPRVVHTLFRDPFNKRVMALVIGTFTYCIVVLRSVRSALEADGEPIIPNLAVALAVGLGIAAILAIVAFIDHAAHTMDVSEILERAPRDHRADPRDLASRRARSLSGTRCPAGAGRFGHHGEGRPFGPIQQIDIDLILHGPAPGRLHECGPTPAGTRSHAARWWRSRRRPTTTS